ncbi:MAG: cytochrome c [Deltaproteobacteria bacterium]|jgi:cytochrome c556|nr:cytochrome c [Deltaproteobacteria bacterium]
MKKRQKILVVAVILAGVGVLIGAVSAQFSRPEDAIKYRKSVMVIIAQHFGRLGAMVKGAETFDQDKFANNAAIVDAMAKLPWEAFLAAGSDRGDTTMKSSVLKDSDQFKKMAASFEQETGRLSSAAKDGDADAAKRQFGNVAKSCKECHSQFRR